jgi:hypothetical protein
MLDVQETRPISRRSASSIVGSRALRLSPSSTSFDPASSPPAAADRKDIAE